MTRRDQSAGIRDRSGADRDFLFRQTDPAVRPAKTVRKSSVCLEELSRRFPGILVGRGFSAAAADFVRPLPRFGAMAVRIDQFSPKKDISGKAYAAALLLDVAGAIDDACAAHGGIWGLMDRKVFGCVLSGAGADRCRAVADGVRRNLSERRAETLTVGIAAFPTLDYGRDRILDNARKALDHAACFGPAGTAAFDAVSLNISGDRLYGQGDVHGAIGEFQAARRLDPKNVNVLNSLGVCYGAIGSLDEALAAFSAAAAVDPAEVMALYNAGLIRRLKGDPRGALELFKSAFQTDGTLFEAALQAGRIHLELGRTADAIVQLERAAGIRPDSAAAHRYLGEAHTVENRPDLALKAYKRAVRLNPSDAAALSAMGQLFYEQGENLEIALTFCRHSVDLAPDNGLFHFRLGCLYETAGRLSEALDAYIQAADRGYDAGNRIEAIQSRLTARAS